MKERKEVRQRSREHWKGSKLAYDLQHTGYEVANTKQKQQKQ